MKLSFLFTILALFFQTLAFAKTGEITTESARTTTIEFDKKTIMNVGEESSLVVERLFEQEGSLITLKQGKIRIKIKDSKAPFFLKANESLVMLEKGEALFQLSPYTQFVSIIVFEGTAKIKKIEKEESDLVRLKRLANTGEAINPGEFSVWNGEKSPTYPAKLSRAQFFLLEKNKQLRFETNLQVEASTIAAKSIVPPGLDGIVVGTGEPGLLKALKKLGIDEKKLTQEEISEDEIRLSKGFYKKGILKPVDGSFLHLSSSKIIPIPFNADFDRKTKEWTSPYAGGVNKFGEYLSGEGFLMTREGKLLRRVPSEKEENQFEVKEVLFSAYTLDQNKLIGDWPLESYEGANPFEVAEKNTQISRTPSSFIESQPQELPVPPLPIGVSYKPNSHLISPPSSPLRGQWGNRRMTPVSVRIRGN